LVLIKIYLQLDTEIGFGQCKQLRFIEKKFY